MSWITLTEDDILKLAVAPRITAARTSALADGQTDPLPEIIAEVSELVRGYVSAGKNPVGDSGTIPSRLRASACDIITNRILGRIGDADDHWKDKEDQAIRLLEQVAAGKFQVVDPATINPDEPTSTGSGVTRIEGQTTQLGRNDFAGL